MFGLIPVDEGSLRAEFAVILAHLNARSDQFVGTLVGVVEVACVGASGGIAQFFDSLGGLRVVEILAFYLCLITYFRTNFCAI